MARGESSFKYHLLGQQVRDHTLVVSGLASPPKFFFFFFFFQDSWDVPLLYSTLPAHAAQTRQRWPQSKTGLSTRLCRVPRRGTPLPFV
jgi:hypothetical protein